MRILCGKSAGGVLALPLLVGIALSAAASGVERVEFKGFVGRKAATLLEGRVFSRYAREDVMDEAVRAFETHYDDTHKPGNGYWQGEFWGKTMLGHAGACRHAGRADARDYVLAQVDRLVGGHMRPDGYLGTYDDPRFVKGGWNIWGRKYTLWALVEAYEATGERRVLDAAAKTADQMIGIVAVFKIIVSTFSLEVLFGLLTMIVCFSIILTSIEPNIETFPDALWYCFAVVTTIGFGDVVAVTPAGRILSVMLGIYGLIVVAVITSIIVNFYNATAGKQDQKELEDIKDEEKKKK